MTSSATTITTARNGGDTTTAQEAPREHGLTVLRDREARALVDLASDALSETSYVGYELHRLIYDRDHPASYDQLRKLLEEALTCWQAADHYLRMLDSTLEERHYDQHSPPVEPAF